MMERWQSEEDRRAGSAVAASLLLHALLFAWLLPQLVANNQPALESVETISFKKIAHVSMERARVPSAAHVPILIARVPKAAPVQKPRASHAKKKAPPSRKSPNAPVIRPAGAVQPQPVALAQQTGTPAPALAKPALAAAARAQTATPAAADRRDQHQQVAAATGNTNGGGNGIFLNTDAQAPVLELGASQELKRRFRMNLTLVVLVTDDGKTKEIEFHPPASADVEKEIRDLLAAAHWDAAQCGGGIPCEGKATIKLFQ
jgi:hypothetical protein